MVARKEWSVEENHKKMIVYCIITVLAITVTNGAKQEKMALNSASVDGYIKENNGHLRVKRVEKRSVNNIGEQQTTLLSNMYSIILISTISVMMCCGLFISCWFCSGGGSKIDQIYDGCTSSTAYYKYMIKFKFGRHSKQYPAKSTYIMIDFIDERRLFITRIAIPPLWMSSKRIIRAPTKSFKNMKIAKFQLNRGTPMPDISYVRLAHDCYNPLGQSLTVYALEIKDLMANTITNIPIFTDVQSIGPDRDHLAQNFKAQAPTVVKQNEDDMFLEGITPYITIPEYSVFFVFYISVNIFITLFVPYSLKINTINRAIINGLVASIIAIALTAFVTTVYKRGIKRSYATNHGTGAWGLIRLIYLIIILLLACVMIATGAVIGSALEDDIISNWFISIILATIILIVLYVPMLLSIGFKTGFIEVSKVKVARKFDPDPVIQKPLEPVQPNPPIPTPKEAKGKTASAVSVSVKPAAGTSSGVNVKAEPQIVAKK